MHWKALPHPMIVAAAVALGFIGGCKTKGSETATGNPPSAADTGTSMAAPTDTAAMASTKSGNWSDPNIVALLDEANKADSAAGAYALTKATSPDVKAFARLMMGEHHALRVQGQQLAKKLSVTPQPPADDPLPAAANGEMTALKAAPKGAQFDRTYIEQEISVHKAVLDLADKAHDATQNAELKALIEKAKPIIEKHRDRAEQIQKKLGKATA
jgi:putative membrane protein